MPGVEPAPPAPSGDEADCALLSMESGSPPWSPRGVSSRPSSDDELQGERLPASGLHLGGHPAQLRRLDTPVGTLLLDCGAARAVLGSRGCRGHWSAASLLVFAALISVGVLTSWHRAPRVQELEHAQSLWIDPTQFQKIGTGKCTELGWLPITTRAACEAAARHLGLHDKFAAVTHLPHRPEGCYYFTNREDGTETLWLALDASNRGSGAMSDKHGFREPICRAQTTPKPPSVTAVVSTTPRAQGLLSDALDSFAGYQQVSTGRCSDNWKPIDDIATCEAAAVYLNLKDATATVSASPDRPEGCYYFRSSVDATEALWLGTNTADRGVGTRRSVDGIRQQLCVYQAPTTTFTTTTTPANFTRNSTSTLMVRVVAANTTTSPPSASSHARVQQTTQAPAIWYRKVSKGTCADRGWFAINDISECEAAAVYLDFKDVRASKTAVHGRPEGCYAWHKSGSTNAFALWVSTNASNAGIGAMSEGRVTREPICAVGRAPAESVDHRSSSVSRTASADTMTTTAKAEQHKTLAPMTPMSWQGCFFPKNVTGGVLRHASTSTNCAWACREYKVIALKDGRCLCSNELPAPPEYRKVADSLCGAICPQEKELTPLRYCGGTFAYAVYGIDADILPISEANVGG